jgi:transcriptional regulator NrdR family protein
MIRASAIRTNEELTRLIKDNPTLCPYCGCDALQTEEDSVLIDDKTATVSCPTECAACERRWTQFYKFERAAVPG